MRDADTAMLSSPDKQPPKRPRTGGKPRGPAAQELDFSAMSEHKQMIMHRFTAYRDSLDAHYDRRERVIKCSRDITALSKKIVFALLRITQNPPEKVFAEAECKHEEVLGLFKKLSLELQGSNAFRYNRQATPGVQEYIEAISLWHFLEHNELMTMEQVLDRLSVEEDGERRPLVMVTKEDYLLGISDLPGEVNRYCINSIGKGDYDAVKRSLEFLRQLKEGINHVLCNAHIRDLEKKVPVLDSSLQKIEQAFYSKSIRDSELRKIESSMEEYAAETPAAA
ncbi:hypothetical protein GGF46_003297 [Coemansia sp. RSA 552]|nr:hypothetical protein GGF46_003297 [Coemansia sp. RSA 552]